MQLAAYIIEADLVITRIQPGDRVTLCKFLPDEIIGQLYQLAGNPEGKIDLVMGLGPSGERPGALLAEISNLVGLHRSDRFLLLGRFGCTACQENR